MTPAQRKALQELRDDGYAVIVWSPADVKAIRPKWSDEKCAEELASIASDLQDASVESGWEQMEILLS